MPLSVACLSRALIQRLGENSREGFEMFICRRERALQLIRDSLAGNAASCALWTRNSMTGLEIELIRHRLACEGCNIPDFIW